MLSLRWFEPEPDEASVPVDWPAAAAVLATLFLNVVAWLTFCERLPEIYPLPRYALNMAVIAVATSGLFFLGPMLLAHRWRRPLFGIIECSFGRIPMWGVRVCAVVFLVFWLGDWTSVLRLFWTRPMFGDATDTKVAVLAALILLFLAVTAMQSPRMDAKLASFTVQLAIAILIAGLLRVNEGWESIPQGLTLRGDRSGLDETWGGLAELAW